MLITLFMMLIKICESYCKLESGRPQRKLGYISVAANVFPDHHDNLNVLMHLKNYEKIRNVLRILSLFIYDYISSFKI